MTINASAEIAHIDPLVVLQRALTPGERIRPYLATIDLPVANLHLANTHIVGSWRLPTTIPVTVPIRIRDSHVWVARKDLEPSNLRQQHS